ncbi:MAG: 4-hydroxy-3-methylbut-2-enyl diphosphate reductase [Gemmataceae bacterium]
MNVILANPRGFCAGVVMAIDSLDRAIALYGTPLYAYHEVVHNRPVVERFRDKGVVFVDSIEEVPEGGTVLYSAHGVAPQIRAASAKRNLRTVDATCPLVTKVHKEALKYAKEGKTIILIGHEGHDEVVGTMGEVPHQIVLVESEDDVERLDLPADAPVAYLTQTTLSVDETKGIIAALKRKFPRIVGPAKDDICYATQNRQEAVHELAAAADVVLVLGSRNSSNSRRLVEIAASLGKPAYLIDGPREIRNDWFRPDSTVLVTAGASAPEDVVQACLDHLRSRFGAAVEERTIKEEDVHFPLPLELRVV